MNKAIFTLSVIQMPLNLSCSIAVQRVLFDFGFKKLFNKRLAFPPLYRDFYILRLSASKDHWVPRMLFVL